MYRLITPLVILLFLIASCNHKEERSDNLLEQNPYKQLTDSIKIQPSNADLYYKRGSLLYNNNQVLHAQEDMLKAWQLKPTEEYALGVTTALKETDVDTAISFLKAAIKQLPKSISLQIALARGYQVKKKYDEAISVCDNILNQNPNQLDALTFKSEILKDQKKDAEALAVLEKAHASDPSNKELSYNLAYEYADAKNIKAIQLADTLIHQDRTETVSRAYYIKATYYNNVGNSVEALKNYDAAITHNYNFLDPYLDKGQLLYKLKQYPTALKNFELALKVSPSTADFYYWLGKTQQAMGDIKNAKLNYERAYGLDKTLTEAREASDSL
ncbi:MAG: tetratricopeptide repeat protein [Candidatus Dadabacteria bacterium]